MKYSGTTSNNAQQPPQLPADKMDVDSVPTLEQLDATTLAPYIPELLTWIQDMNWPIATPVLRLLKHLPLVTEPVADILRGDDDPWKSNCLEYPVKDMPCEQHRELMPELERIAGHPNTGEIEEEVHLTAEAIPDSMQDIG